MDLEKVFKIEKKQVASIESLITQQNRPLPMEVLVDCISQKIRQKIADQLTFKVYDPDNNYLEGDNIYWKKNNFFGRVINRQDINREHTLIEVLWDTVLSGKPADSYQKKNKNVRVFYLINGDADSTDVEIYKQVTRRKIAENQIDTNNIAESLYDYLHTDRTFVFWRRKWYLRSALTPISDELFDKIVNYIIDEKSPVMIKHIVEEIFGVKEKDLKYPSLSFSVNYHLSRRSHDQVKLLSTRGDGEWVAPEWISKRIPKLPDFISEPRIYEESLSTYVSRDYYPHDIQIFYNKQNSKYERIFDTSHVIREFEPLERILGFWEYQTGKIVLTNIEKLYFPRQHRLVFVEQHNGKEFECFYDYEKGIIGGLEKWVALNMIPGGELEFRDLGYGDKFELRWRRSKKSFDYSPLRFAIASGELVEDGSKVAVRCGINKNFFIDPEDYGEIKDLFAWVKNPKLSIDHIIHELFVRFGPKIKIEKLATYFSILAGPWFKTCMAICSSIIASDNGFLQGRGEKGNGIFHFDEETAAKIEIKDEYDIVKASFRKIMIAENEGPAFYGGEASLRVILRDYSYWIRLKDQNDAKALIENDKEEGINFSKNYLKKSILKKATNESLTELLDIISSKYLDVPIAFEKITEKDFSTLKKGLFHLFETPKNTITNMADVIAIDGKYHVPAIPANFYFWLAQAYDPSTFMGFNDHIETKLEKTCLVKWNKKANSLDIFNALCEILKLVKRVRPAYDAIDFLHALDFAVELKGTVYLDQILNDVIREQVKLVDINKRRDERLKAAKTRRELKKLQDQAEKARSDRDAEEVERAETEKAKTEEEKSDKGSTNKKLPKGTKKPASSINIPQTSAFTVLEKSDIKFTAVSKFLKPQLAKRLTKIHTSLKNIRPFKEEAAESYANTLYWYWIDWLWKFIVQQKKLLKIDISYIPEIQGVDRETSAIIGAVRELMKAEELKPNFDEIKYQIIMNLKSMIHAGEIKLKNYEMTDFTDVPILEKQDSSSEVASKEDKNRIKEIEEYFKSIQKCVKCPLIPNIKCNIFNDGSDGLGKISVRSLADNTMSIINAKILLVADLPLSDRSDFVADSNDNIFKRAIRGTGVSPADFAGTFMAKCSAIGDKINRTMMANCSEHLRKEVNIIQPQAIIVIGEKAGEYLKLDKGKWSKWNKRDIYFVKNIKDLGKDKPNPEGLVKEILSAFARMA